jgi:hypothetical protein
VHGCAGLQVGYTRKVANQNLQGMPLAVDFFTRPHSQSTEHRHWSAPTLHRMKFETDYSLLLDILKRIWGGCRIFNWGRI